MTGLLATIICMAGIAYLLIADRRRAVDVSGAVWIPLIWMLLSGSRYVSQWLDLGAPGAVSAQAYDDGSPLDRNVFIALIVAGVWVLLRRPVDWFALLRRNVWLLLFLLFALTSVAWSDDPFISLKRWVKGAGNVIMALVILTERHPYEALGVVMRRLGFVLLPLSVLFIRFFPELGRQYHMGQVMYSGVTFSKNSLGQVCLITGIYFTWELLLGHSARDVNSMRESRRYLRVRLDEYVPYVVMLPMVAWLLYRANSATSTALMVVAACFLLFARIPSVARNPVALPVAAFATAAIIGVLATVIDITDAVIRLLGRQPDLTSRTPVWAMLLDMVPNRLLGAGYESFWSGDRLVQIWSRMGVDAGGIIQAHNGYIETYLNLGLVGLLLLVASIVAGLVKAAGRLRIAYAPACLAIAYVLTAVIYNYTEAAFKPLNNLFVLLLFSIVHVTARRRPSVMAARPKAVETIDAPAYSPAMRRKHG